MKKQDLAARLARKARLSRAAAADQLDRVIHEILADLKKGRSVSLPGFGTFKPGRKLNFTSEPQKPKKGPRRAKKR
jgi:DNA-binding protein HU-beta